jgi:hypothetical protein
MCAIFILRLKRHAILMTVAIIKNLKSGATIIFWLAIGTKDEELEVSSLMILIANLKKIASSLSSLALSLSYRHMFLWVRLLYVF